MPNCPDAKLSGAKLSWCQIVLVSNCPVPNCPTTYRSYYTLRRGACWRRPAVPIDLLSEWFQVETFDHQLLPIWMSVTQVTVLLVEALDSGVEFKFKDDNFCFCLLFLYHLPWLPSPPRLLSFQVDLQLGLLNCKSWSGSHSPWTRWTGPRRKTVVVLITNITLRRCGIWILDFKHHEKLFLNTTKKIQNIFQSVWAKCQISSLHSVMFVAKYPVELKAKMCTSGMGRRRWWRQTFSLWIFCPVLPCPGAK